MILKGGKSFVQSFLDFYCFCVKKDNNNKIVTAHRTSSLLRPRPWSRRVFLARVITWSQAETPTLQKPPDNQQSNG